MTAPVPLTQREKNERDLYDAARLVERVLVSLDPQPVKCHGCGATRYRKFGEHVVGRELGGLPDKIRKMVAKLGDNGMELHEVDGR